MANRLAQELSPYLLQHAGNPVDWRPWNAEALGGAAGAEADLSVDRLLFLSLVSRDGPRELRGPGHRPVAEPPLRQHQGRPRGAARSGSDLHGSGADDDRPGRLADVGVSDAGGEAVFRRDVLAAARSRRHARLRPGAWRHGRRVAEPLRRIARPGRAYDAVTAGSGRARFRRRSGRAGRYAVRRG